MNDRLNRAVERLLLDKRFLRSFRRDPEATLRPLELTSEEIEAVKEGDAARLVALGLDPRFAWPKVRSPLLPLWMLARAKKLTPALVLAALVLPATPAAARRRSAGPSSVGEVSRYFGRRRVAGAFYSGLARAGRAGSLASSAATRRDTSAYLAAARKSAREAAIQPPPGGETP